MDGIFQIIGVILVIVSVIRKMRGRQEEAHEEEPRRPVRIRTPELEKPRSLENVSRSRGPARLVIPTAANETWEAVLDESGNIESVDGERRTIEAQVIDDAEYEGHSLESVERAPREPRKEQPHQTIQRTKPVRQTTLPAGQRPRMTSAPAMVMLRSPKHRFDLTPATARQAVVWMEVLGPPKGLQ